MWQSGEHKKVTKLYELKKTLGRGHFAVVKLAHHLLTGEKVAIKVIDKTKLDKVSADHLYHEVTCMKLVQHPNVVRLYQVIETDTKLYLILELGDGGDMFDYIMRHDKGLKECHAKEYFSQILSAIVYCHKLHVVHRDLKPENVVFFESQGLVKLTDFGFSNCYRPGEKLSTSCGSLAYSAPEILLGEEYDAPAVDVWSLGVILYMLVCGVAPFNEANDSETLTNIMDCKYTILDHVSDHCKDLISRMIIKDPCKRITLDDIMKHEWLKGAKSLQQLAPSFTGIIPENLHEKVIEMMVKTETANKDEIMKAVREDRYDHITSTYYLLAERFLLEQRKSCVKATEDHPEMTKEAAPQPSCRQPPCPNTTYSCYETGVYMSPRHRSNSCNLDEISVKPPYIREHLTITPRRGFSVVRGGIDALIEEEERSRSQTTTDDEDEGDELLQMNPNVLASRLQRASLQIKRMKKRKSAPMVLNEICEENESECGTDVTSSSLIATDDDVINSFGSWGQNISPSATSKPTFPSPSLPNMVQRAGDRGRCAVRTTPTTEVDAEGDDSATSGSSSRASSANLTSVVTSKLLRQRRDSSDDHDDEGLMRKGSRDHSLPPAPFPPLSKSTSGDGEGKSRKKTSTNCDEINNLRINLSSSSSKFRSRSAELQISRSSCSSLSSYHVMRLSRHRCRNSSSTLSDTGLVARLTRSPFRPSRHFLSTSSTCLLPPVPGSKRPASHLHHKRFYSLQVLNNQLPHNHITSSRSSSCFATDPLPMKRVNVTSSTSKFPVDPANEFKPLSTDHKLTGDKFTQLPDHVTFNYLEQVLVDNPVVKPSSPASYDSSVLSRLGRLKAIRQSHRPSRRMINDFSRKRRRNSARNAIPTSDEMTRRVKHECCTLM